ncbi:hypothetical protein [Sphingomonas immobilis]|uniref:Lipoprotein n=1 Tax=Sphingomonas immobilis TaxID=3063997 RepID=A0ABT8ZUD0_9SPHN|nr:hypothetical protein [Sphingomonas sp. CA1-15]MDO7841169.1 hypothetical protein [Sphingomonas sp. CA1-15]
MAHADSAAMRERPPARPAVAPATVRRRGFAAAGLATALALAGCNKTGVPTDAYRHLDDQAKAVTGGVFGYPCKRPARHADGTAYLQDTDIRDCYRFGDARPMRGIIYGTDFYENANKRPSNYWNSTRSVVTTSPGVKWWAKLGEPRCEHMIELIGRRTVIESAHGYPNSTNNAVLIDRVVNLKRLPGTCEKPTTLKWNGPYL